MRNFLLPIFLVFSAMVCSAQSIENINYEVTEIKSQVSPEFDSLKISYVMNVNSSEKIKKLTIRAQNDKAMDQFNTELIYLRNKNMFIDRKGTLYKIGDKGELKVSEMVSARNQNSIKIKEIKTEIIDEKGNKKVKQKAKPRK